MVYITNTRCYVGSESNKKLRWDDINDRKTVQKGNPEWPTNLTSLSDELISRILQYLYPQNLVVFAQSSSDNNKLSIAVASNKLKKITKAEKNNK